MTWAIIGYSLVGCIGMAVMDFVGTVLVKAVSAGRGNLAGSMDAVGDLAKITILSVAATRLTSNYGIWGWLGVLPILLTGFFVTKHATKLSMKIENDEEAAEEEAKESKMRWMERELILLKQQAKRR
jgi:uncharacterized membrane protein YjfL (UPF0719 family)